VLGDIPADLSGVAAQPPVTPPPSVSSILSPILGGNLESSEKKKSLSQLFVQEALNSVIPALGTIPTLFGTLR
jgi:hypothetical protein